MRAIFTVLAIWGAGLGAAAQYGKMSVLFGDFANIYPDHAPVALGLIVSVVGIVGLIFGTTAGMLVARVGPRRALVLALALGALMAALQAIGLNYPLMIVSRVLEGASHLAVVVVAPTVIAGVAAPRFRPLAMILWSTFFSLTYAILALAAPPIIAAHGASGLYTAHALWMAISAVVMQLILPADPAPPARSKQGILAQHITIYRSPYLAAPALGFFAYAFVYVATMTLLPPALPADTSGQWRAIAAGGMPLMSILCSLTIGVWLMARIPAVRVAQLGYAVGIPCFLAVGFAWGNGVAMVVAGLLCAAAMGVAQGASFAAVPELNPEIGDRALASGALAQMGNLATSLGTPVMAAVLGLWGGFGLAILAAVMCSFGILIHIFTALRRAKQAARI